MPSAYADHGSMADIARDKARPHGVAASASAPAPRRQDSAISPANDEVLASRAKTRSWDYIWRTGVAGGVAGCAVSCSSRRQKQSSVWRRNKYSQSSCMQALFANRFTGRPKRRWRLLIASKSSSKPATPSSQSTQAPHSESLPR